MSDISGDGRDARASRPSEPDAHGQAAFLLLESLIHQLIARDVITNDTAIEVVRVAVDIKTEIADELGDSLATFKRSIGLLEKIAASLETDRLT